ncbi:MAG: hypothetical protein IPM82_19700 [Saprospiraceae bacterium]|nr:hypothetical protein [Saprospiraceae bacterium]
MKKTFAIFAAAVILISSMSNALLVAEFKLNQAEIERLYCVNKAKPKMQCHGKCHLKQELAKNNDHNQPSPLNNLEQSFKINFFHQQLQPVVLVLAKDSNLPVSDCQLSFISRLFGKSLFQPPDNQQTV